jgi:tetratricopeptide (TPR) repeat protein
MGLRLIVCLVVLMGSPIGLLKAQNPCDGALKEAQYLYDAGKIQDAVALLEYCPFDHLSRLEQFETHRLLALCYQFLSDEEQTDAHIQRMLELNPNYQTFPYVDPVEFTQTLSHYGVRPDAFAGMGVGLNAPRIRPLELGSPYHSPVAYRAQLGYDIRWLVGYRFQPDASVQVQFNYKELDYSKRVEQANDWAIQVDERWQMMGLELGLSQQGTIGGSWYWDASLQASFWALNKAQVKQRSEQGETVFLASKNVSSERSPFQVSLQPVISVGREQNKRRSWLSVAYTPLLRPSTTMAKASADLNHALNQQDIADPLRLGLWSVSLSIAQDIHYTLFKR